MTAISGLSSRNERSNSSACRPAARRRRAGRAPEEAGIAGRPRRSARGPPRRGGARSAPSSSSCRASRPPRPRGAPASGSRAYSARRTTGRPVRPARPQPRGWTGLTAETPRARRRPEMGGSCPRSTRRAELHQPRRALRESRSQPAHLIAVPPAALGQAAHADATGAMRWRCRPQLAPPDREHRSAIPAPAHRAATPRAPGPSRATGRARVSSCCSIAATAPGGSSSVSTTAPPASRATRVVQLVAPRAARMGSAARRVPAAPVRRR